jgi:hypothetical protein
MENHHTKLVKVKPLMENVSLVNIIHLINTNTLGLVEENGEIEDNLEIMSNDYPEITILYKPLYIGNWIAKFMSNNIFFPITKTENKPTPFDKKTEQHVEDMDLKNSEELDPENKLAYELMAASVRQTLPKIGEITEFKEHPIKITEVETEIYDFFVLKRIDTLLLSMSLLEFIMANSMSDNNPENNTSNIDINTFMKEEKWNVFLKIYI